jgi:hypothetical protein
MRRIYSRAGFTLTEAVMTTAITGLLTVAAVGLFTGTIKSTTRTMSVSMAQEGTRLGLSRLEERFVHASEVRVASATFVEYVVDVDQSPSYDKLADPDGDVIPNYLDADRDGDAALLMPATAQWQIGFNLKDDDEDGDGKIDCRQRLYLSGKDLMFDMSLDEAAWGGQYLRKLAVNVSTLSFTYFGNKANPLGKSVDPNNDGVVSSTEIDAVAAPSGAGNNNGSLDKDEERAYLTTLRVDLGIDGNKDGTTDHKVQTDVYPPLLPVKTESF